MATAAEVEALSLELEGASGYDSIPTIRRAYPRRPDAYGDETGPYECVWPGCRFARRDVAAMWRHVHFSDKHGRSFGLTYRQMLESRGLDV